MYRGELGRAEEETGRNDKGSDKKQLLCDEREVTEGSVMSGVLQRDPLSGREDRLEPGGSDCTEEMLLAVGSLFISHEKIRMTTRGLDRTCRRIVGQGGQLENEFQYKR